MEAQSLKGGAQLLIKEAKRQRPLLLLGAIGMLCVNCLEIGLPLTIRGALDSIGAKDLSNLSWWISVYLILATGQMISRATWRFAYANSMNKSARNFRDEMVSCLVKVPATTVEKRQIGNILSINSSDTDTSSRVFDLGMIFFIDTVVPLILVPITMYMLSPRLMLFVLLPLPIVPLIALRRDKRIYQEHLKTQSELGELSGYVRESFAGIRTIKAITREQSFSAIFKEKSYLYVKRALGLVTVEAGFGPTLEIVLLVAFILLYLGGGPLVIEGVISIGTFVAFHRYTQQLMWPTQALGLTIATFRKGRTSGDRIASVINETPEEVRSLKLSSELLGEFKVNDLSFSRNSIDQTLKSISLKAKSQSRTAILGEVGSGKTTLLEVLSGLESIPLGKVFLDGVDLATLSPTDWRKQFSYVSQTPILFNCSILENLLLGNDSQDLLMEQVVNACKMAEIHNEIKSFPAGYETILGERGVVLSGGQRQRISLARALLKKAPVLVLDSFLSSVDSDTEQRIIDNLRNLKTTLIFSTQRASTLALAENVLVLKDGKILEQGSSEELLLNPGSWLSGFLKEQSRMAVSA